MTAYRTKGTVSEDEVYALVQRYGASTIFTLLQEVSQAIEKDAMIDWRTLVKATSTGISNAQEYQMLWRHLAYRDPLEKVEDGGEPLSDESDLEFELEATPNPSEEISTEVDCCVKVILSSGSVGDCSPVVALNVDAPPTTDTPNDHASAVPSDKQHFGRYNRATNGAALYIQKQPLSIGTSYEGLDGNGSSNSLFPAKKKRKLWTKEEDVELIAAVEKFGEGNWANILKGDFKHDRTASQLSQRWAIIRKRQTTSKQSNGSKARSEEMLAAQKAFSMALNMPMSGSLSTILSGGTQMQTTNSSTSIAGGTSGAVDEATASQASKQNQQPVNQETSSLKAPSNPSNKLRTTTVKKPPSAQLKPSICPNPLIKAAAFAAGGRIATPSTAASLFKAAQSKSAVRFRHGCGSSLTGSSVNSTVSSSSAAVAGTATGSAPVATVITGTHSLNTRVIHPSVSLTSSGSALITSKLCQVQACSGKSSSLPSNTSNTSVQPLSSELRLGVPASSGTQENGKRRSVITSAIDVDEPMAEEARCERDNEASDKLVRVTENGGSGAAATGSLPVDEREINDNQCAETEQIQSKKSKEEEIRETKGSSEAMNLNSGDSKLDEEVELKAKGKSEDKGFS